MKTTLRAAAVSLIFLIPFSCASGEQEGRRLICLSNKDSADRTFDIPSSGLAFPDDGELIAFDCRGNTLTPPFKNRLVHTLPPQSHTVLAVCQILDRPQIISTSRHIAQGFTNVSSLVWNPVTRTLSGISQAIAGDRTELRILTRTRFGTRMPPPASAAITGSNGYELTVAPGDGLVTRPDDAYAHANTPDAPFTTLFEPAAEENLVRLAFISGADGPVAWRVTFLEREK